MKKIALVSTGGTIAMKSNEAGLAVPTAGAKELIGLIGITKFIKNEIILEDIEFKNIPSAHMTLEDLVMLRDLVVKLSHSGYDGIVITHGTDTIEETAYFLDLTINLNVPVVLTGSQRNISALSSDMELNIVDSVLTATDKGALDKGVLIVFASEIITAREATKTHRTRTDTFKSMEFGPVGTVDNNRVIWTRKPLIRDTYEFDNFGKMEVDIIPSYLGANSRMFYNSLEDGVDGIVLQGLGAGHIPESMIDGIKKAISASIPVVLSSRTMKGRFLTNTYGFVGSEKYLRNIGVIFGEDLSSQKVRMKLLVLLSTKHSCEEIRYEFEKNYYK